MIYGGVLWGNGDDDGYDDTPIASATECGYLIFRKLENSC